MIEKVFDSFVVDHLFKSRLFAVCRAASCCCLLSFECLLR